MAATDIEHGLSTAEVEERIAAGKINRNMELKTKSVRELIIENLCTLFNLINVVLAILVLLTGSFKNLTFLFVVFLNTAIGVIQSMRSKRMVDKLTLLTSKKAIAVRDGAEVELDLDQIVLDDIIRLGRGDQIPADAVVVSGEALVNESLLTGESDLIKKQPGSELMSGSFIDSGLLRARVIHVGADNYVAKINNEAKYVKKVNSEIMNALNAIVRFASLIMIPLGLALFASSVSELWDAAGTPGDSALSWCFSELLAGRVPSSALLSTVGALLGMIPQGLVLLTSSVLAIATVRLARRKVLAQQLYCIETLARVDVLCLDKTGTITSGRMEVEGTYPLPVEGVGFGADSDEAAVPVETTVLDFALANVARATSQTPTRPVRRCSTTTPTARSRCPSRWRSFRSRRLKSGAAPRLRRLLCDGRSAICAFGARLCAGREPCGRACRHLPRACGGPCGRLYARRRYGGRGRARGLCDHSR